MLISAIHRSDNVNQCFVCTILNCLFDISIAHHIRDCLYLLMFRFPKIMFDDFQCDKS